MSHFRPCALWDEMAQASRSRAPTALMASLMGVLLLGGEIVHDHHVAGLQGRGQHLLDIGQEPGPVHRAVEHHRGGHARQPQGSDEGGRLPVTVRHAAPQPLPARRSPVAAGHLGRGSRLINERRAARGRGRAGCRTRPDAGSGRRGPKRRSPPRGPGRTSPCVRTRERQRIALAALTPKPGRRLTARHPALNRRDHTITQIYR